MIFIARFCSLSRSSLRYDGSARWKTGHAYSSIDLIQVLKVEKNKFTRGNSRTFELFEAEQT